MSLHFPGDSGFAPDRLHTQTNAPTQPESRRAAPLIFCMSPHGVLETGKDRRQAWLNAYGGTDARPDSVSH